MRATRLSSFAFALLVVGASAATAIACPNNDKSASTASASGECPYAHGSNASASLASTAHEGCGASAKAASAHEGCGMSAKNTVASAGGTCTMHGASSEACSYGKNTVTMAGDACPAGKNADYAFAVKSADCPGTSQAVAKAIKSMKGVAAVTVDYKSHMAYVCADGSVCDPAQVANCLKKAGFADAKFVNADHANCAKSHGKVQS